MQHASIRRILHINRTMGCVFGFKYRNIEIYIFMNTKKRIISIFLKTNVLYNNRKSFKTWLLFFSVFFSGTENRITLLKLSENYYENRFEFDMIIFHKNKKKNRKSFVTV